MRKCRKEFLNKDNYSGFVINHMPPSPSLVFQKFFDVRVTDHVSRDKSVWEDVSHPFYQS